MSSLWGEPDSLTAAMQKAVAADLEERAERIVQKAVKEYEMEVRRSLARAVQVVMEKSFSVERHGADLVVTVRHVY